MRPRGRGGSSAGEEVGPSRAAGEAKCPGRAPRGRPGSRRNASGSWRAGRGGPVGGGGSRRPRCWWWRCWERAAFFGVAGNLVLYLNSAELKWAGEQASRAACLPGCSYLLAPVGGLAGRRALGPLPRHRAQPAALPSRLWPAGLHRLPRQAAAPSAERYPPAAPGARLPLARMPVYLARHLLRPHPLRGAAAARPGRQLRQEQPHLFQGRPGEWQRAGECGERSDLGVRRLRLPA